MVEHVSTGRVPQAVCDCDTFPVWCIKKYCSTNFTCMIWEFIRSRNSSLMVCSRIHIFCRYAHIWTAMVLHRKVPRSWIGFLGPVPPTPMLNRGWKMIRNGFNIGVWGHGGVASLKKKMVLFGGVPFYVGGCRILSLFWSHRAWGAPYAVKVILVFGSRRTRQSRTG